MGEYAGGLLSAWKASAGQPLARRLVLIHTIDCVGNGVQFSTLALYLNRRSGLSVWQIGLGLAIGGGFGVLSNLAAGRLSDAWGPRRLLATVLTLLGVTFCTLPLVGSLASFVVFAIASSLLHFSCGAPFMALIGQAFGASDRARGRAMIRSFGNAGMALGAAASAVLLAVSSPAFLEASPFINGASFLVAALLVARLGLGGVPAADRPPRSAGMHAALEPGMPAFIASTAVLGLHSSLLAVGIPLWISSTRIAPAWSIPLLIGLNTVIVVALQVPAAQRSGVGFASAVRGSRLAGLLGAAGCAVLSLSLLPARQGTALTVLAIGFLLLTATELLQNGAAFYFGLNLGPDERRGEYASAFNVTHILEGIAGPLAIGALFTQSSPWSWLVFAAALIVAALIYRGVAARLSHLAVDLEPTS